MFNFRTKGRKNSQGQRCFQFQAVETVLSLGSVPLVLVTFDKSDTISHFENCIFPWQLYPLKQLLSDLAALLDHWEKTGSTDASACTFKPFTCVIQRSVTKLPTHIVDLNCEELGEGIIDVKK